MPDTIEALIIFLIAVLPGALHTWAFEREVGNWGVSRSDRLVRFVGATAVYQALAAYPLYFIWTRILHVRTMSGGETTYHNLLTDSLMLPAWSWLVPILYVSVPLTVGTLAARSIHKRPRLARILVGRDPAPRAWDFFFSRRPEALIRLRLKDDSYVGGLFAGSSYAAGYPDPQDLFLEETYVVLADGTFAPGNSDSDLKVIGSGLLINWGEVKFMEAFPIGANDVEAERSAT